MHKFKVSYTLPYRHDATVGVTAADEFEAIRIVTEAFENGSLWDDTADMPLLYDEYEETGDAPLCFTSEQHDGEFERDWSVIQIRRQKHAMAACKAIVAAYAKGAASGSVEWSDVDEAYSLALEAVGASRALVDPAVAAAWSVLDDFGDDEIIGDLYDGEPALGAALQVLVSQFEYPDWSHKTIGDVRAAVKKGDAR